MPNRLKNDVVEEIAYRLYLDRVNSGREGNADEDWTNAESAYDDAFAAGADSVDLHLFDGTEEKFAL
jgi:hypothetical protein